MDWKLLHSSAPKPLTTDSSNESILQLYLSAPHHLPMYPAGYVSLKTNLGTLNLEVYCDTVQKASENFLRLCERGYYNGTKFHRSIRHFMVS